MGSKKQIRELIEQFKPQIVEIRRTLHRNPELGFEEVQTTALIEDTLQRFGLRDVRKLKPTGICALIGRGQGPTIALRADIDALTVEEKNDVPYKSQTPGVMHACGHDGHTAILLGAAMVLSQLDKEFPGTVKLIFQPAEEGPRYGAPTLIDQGILENPQVDEIYGLHLFPAYPQGKVVIKPGPLLAAADALRIKVIGHGGHAARPHETVDAIVVAAQVVSALQTIVSRQIDPAEQVVLTLGTIQGGTRRSAIADSVEITGTLRTFDLRIRDEALSRMERLISNVARGFGAQADFEAQSCVPPTINDPGCVERVERAALKMLDAEGLIRLEKPVSIGEDFAYYLQKVSGAFMLLGCRSLGQETIHSLHSPRFDFDEEALLPGVALFVQIVLDFFGYT